MEILWKRTVYTEFWGDSPKSAFQQNFHIKKLGETTVFYAVNIAIITWQTRVSRGGFQLSVNTDFRDKGHPQVLNTFVNRDPII